MLYRPCSFIFPCLARNPPHDAAVARRSLPKPRRISHESFTITTFGASQRRPTFAGETSKVNTPVLNAPNVNTVQSATRTSNSTSGYSSFGSISDYPDDDDEQDVYLGRGMPVQLTPLKVKEQSRDVITQIIIDLSYNADRPGVPVVKEGRFT